MNVKLTDPKRAQALRNLGYTVEEVAKETGLPAYIVAQKTHAGEFRLRACDAKIKLMHLDVCEEATLTGMSAGHVRVRHSGGDEEIMERGMYTVLRDAALKVDVGKMAIPPKTVRCNGTGKVRRR